MKPKEEAIQLVEKYLNYQEDWLKIQHPKKALENAKQCALICVDRIMLELDIVEFDDYGRGLDFNGTYYGYWREVKQQINKYESN